MKNILSAKLGFIGHKKGTQENVLKQTENMYDHMVLSLIGSLVASGINIVIGGRTGTGKSTLTNTAIKYINEDNSIVTLDTEYYSYNLTELYPERNIVAEENNGDHLNTHIGQSKLKEDCSKFSLIAYELSNDEDVAKVLQLLNVKYNGGCILNHHTNNTDDLIYYMIDSLVNAGGFTTSKGAIDTVTDTLDVHIIMDRLPCGNRYIREINEIISLDGGKYNVENIISYNRETKTYTTNKWFSDRLNSRVLEKLSAEQTKIYNELYDCHWK